MRKQQGKPLGEMIQVLILEDSVADALLIVAELKRSGRKIFYRRAENEAELLCALAEKNWDVILADYNLPNYGALGALAAVKAAGLDTPFIIVTGAITEELAVAAMKAGAADYIMKDRLSRLTPAVEREIADARIRSEVLRERKRAAEMEANYRAVFETSGAALVLVEEDGLLSLANQQFARLVGYEREEVQGKMNWRDFVADEEANAVAPIDSRPTPLFSQAIYASIVADRQGVRHNVIINVAPLPDGRGRVASLLDVTAGIRVQQVEATLHATESMFQTFMDNIGVGIAVFSPEKRVMSVNRQYALWHGAVDFSRYPSCREWCDRQSQPKFCAGCPLEQALSSGACCMLQHSGDETNRHYRIKTAPVKNAAGEVIAVIEMKEDVTEQIAMETQLRENNMQLAEALQRLKMIQSQLIQQEKLAGIGQLAAGVAHEINNPLGFVTSNVNTLRKYVERLREMIEAYRKFVHNRQGGCQKELEAVKEIGRLEKEKKVQMMLADIPELLQESVDGLARVGEIVRNLRLFSRVDMTRTFDMYDLNGGLESSLLVARNEIKYVADVTTELGELPPIEAVGSEINQVLLNILVNAAQAIRKKSTTEKGRIHIVTRSDAAAVYCSISDTGCGIRPEHQSRIFEPFFTTKEVGQGTGLGLSISYDIIVNKHGGDISVCSDPGEGTTFTLRLPLRHVGKNVENGQTAKTTSREGG